MKRLPWLAAGIAPCFLLIACAAEAEDWRYLNDGPGVVGGIDRETIRLADGIGTARTMTVFESTRDGVDYIVMSAEVDCARAHFRFVDFAGMGRDGTKVFYERDSGAAWEAITPGSPLSGLRAILCDAVAVDSPATEDAGHFVDVARRALSKARGAGAAAG